MIVSELIEKLKEYKQDVPVNVIALCKSFSFTMSCSGGDGCTKDNCDSVGFYVDELNRNENHHSN